MKIEKVEKRVLGCKVLTKQIDGDGVRRQRKEYGANSLFFKKNFKNEKRKIENRKKIKFWRQKDEESGIFPDA